MAKAFNEKEKVLIREKLLEAAIECIKKYGVRKTTVDELATYANISKGAFYLFYDTKERLFYDAVMENHDMLQKALLASLDKNKDHLTIETVTEMLFNSVKESQPFWSALLSSGDMDYLYRKLPKEIVEGHIKHDLEFGKHFFETLPLKENSDLSVVTAALRGIFSTILYVKNIGEDHYNEAIKLLIRGIVLQFLKES